MKLNNPVSVFFEITSKCNLECKHCYNNSCSSSFTSLNIVDFKSIIKELNKSEIYTITISGGEPLLHNNFWEMLSFLKKFNFRICINTNGLLLSDKICMKLLEYNVKDIQVSLDGLECIHDYIRGKGTFNKTLLGINSAINCGINVRIGYTINAINYKFIEEFVKFIIERNVQSVALYRFMPTSIRNLDKKLDLNKLMLMEISKNISYIKEKYSTDNFQIYFEPLSFFSFIHDSRFLKHTKCLAGCAQLTLSSNGDIILCPHLRYSVGNYNDNDISFLWSIQNKSRDFLNNIPNECLECKYAIICKGGCKGFSLAYYNNFNKKDPCCFIDIYEK